MAAPTFVPDELVTAAKMNDLPKGILAYAQTTAGQSGIGTTQVDLTGLTVTLTVPAGRRLLICGYVNTIQAGAGGIEFVAIFKDGAQINGAAFYAATAGYYFTFNLATMDAPTAGSHTYKLRANTQAGTITTQHSATQPGFILVEDLGTV